MYSFGNGRYTLFLLLTLVVSNEAIRTIGTLELSELITSSSSSTEVETANNTNEEDDDKYKDVQELYVTQKLDHMKIDSSATFQQRYFYSSRYVSPSTQQHIRATQPPTYAFLCMGGEGPDMHKSVLVDSVHCTGDMLELAAKLHTERGANVHIFALEHRYYGKSYPTFEDGSNPVENKNLVYLSSRQAILDAMHLVRHAEKTHLKNEKKVPWVTFGGSYPGMLAAWTRLELPDLIYASVSNSAPVQATLDMYQYNDYVGHILKDTFVGGSEACLAVVEKGHQQLGEIFQQTFVNYSQQLVEFNEVARDFNICGGADSLLQLKNVQNFLSESVIDIPMQSNDPSCQQTNCNIEKLCKTILEKSKTMEPIKVLAEIRASQNTKCENIDWNKNIQYWKSTKSAEDNNRSWQWQTCNEFGFYQTCEIDSQCPFAKGYHNKNQDLEICQKAFHVSPEQVAKNVRDSRALYGGWHMQGSRILSVNGDVDPWSTLAITKDHGIHDPHNMPLYMVKGASHHFWTHPPKETDSPEVKKAREVIHKQVTTWLDDFHKVTNDS